MSTCLGAPLVLATIMQFWKFRLQPIVKAIARFFVARDIKDFSSDSDLDDFLAMHKFWVREAAFSRRTRLQEFFGKAHEDIFAAVTRMSEAERNKAMDLRKEKVSKISESCDVPDMTDMGNSLEESRAGLQENPVVVQDSSLIAAIEVVTTASDSKDESFHVSDFIGKRFCCCDKEWHGEPMVQCQTCNKWFHPECIFYESDLRKFENHSWESIQLVCNSTVLAIHIEGGCGTIRLMRADHAVMERDDINIDLCQNLDTDVANLSKSAFDFPDSKETAVKCTVSASAVATSLVVDSWTQTSKTPSAISSSTRKNVSSQTMDVTDDEAKNFWDELDSDIDYEVSDRSSFSPREQALMSLEIDISKKFGIPLSLWNEIFCGGSIKHKFANSKYREILLDGILGIYDECVPAIRSQYLRSPDDGGWVSLYCRHNQCCDCHVQYRIEFLPGESGVEAHTQISGLRNHSRGCIKSRPITGETRSKLREQLQFCAATTLRDRHYDQLTTAQRALGSHVTVPSATTYRKIKSESKPRMKYERWEQNVEAMRCEEQKIGDVFIRSIQLQPQSVQMYSKFQIKAFNFRCDTDIIYFDATGSIIMKDSNPGQFQVYCLLVRNPTRGKLSLPVAAFVSKKHDAVTIGGFLQTFLRDRFQLTRSTKPPARIIIDGSLAIWNSCLRSFSSESRIEYYARCFRIATGVPKECDLSQTFYQNCLSHSMKAAQLMVLKHYKRKQKAVAMKGICRLFLSETLQEMDSLMNSFVILTNCQQTSKLVEQHFRNLIGTKESEEQVDLIFKKMGKDLTARKIPIVDTKSNDDKLEMESPFYKRYLNMVWKFRTSQVCKNHLVTAGLHRSKNNYYSKNFCDVLVKTVSSRLPATSALMLGDLSRHITSSTSLLQQRYFHHYSANYSNISKSPCQNYSKSNRTQGCIEGWFGYLKRKILNGSRASGIDAFAQIYKESVKVAQKKYYDSVYHCKHFKTINLDDILPNPSEVTEFGKTKKVKIVESEFKKTKQRDYGHYTHNFDSAKVKFANIIENESDAPDGVSIPVVVEITSTDVEMEKSDAPDGVSIPVVEITSTDVEMEKSDAYDRQTVSVDLTSSKTANKKDEFPLLVKIGGDLLKNLTSAKFAWDCNNIHDCKRFADSVWDIAVGDIAPHNYAITTKVGVHLSWADLLSVKSRKDSLKESMDGYPPGWLTLQVVHTYSLIAVMEMNQYANKNIACCANPHVTSDILQGKSSDVSRFFHPQQNVNLECDVSLILLPVLWNNHFVLLSFSLKDKQVTLYNSIAWSDLALKLAIHQYLVPILTSLNSIENVDYSECTILIQPDSDSCGVCVCLTADYLCSGLKAVPLKQKSIDNYRIWILYKLVCMSERADPRIKEIAATSKRSCLFRRKPPGCRVEICRLYEEVDYDPKFKDKTAIEAWIDSNSVVLLSVITNLTKLAQSPIEKSEGLAHGYRHSMFLCGDYDSLKEFNKRIEFSEIGIQESLFEDIHKYLMSLFCKVKISISFDRENKTELKREICGFVHKKSIFHNTCSLGYLFNKNKRRVKQYVFDVLFFEGLIFFLHISRNSTYLDISRELGFDKQIMK